MKTPESAQRAGEGVRLEVLDGWRGISILLVLGAHLMPLGPKAWQLNEAAAVMGMALFFTLSGFLITRFLQSGHGVADFTIRRLCRILPLAFTYLAIALPLSGAAASAYPAHFLFYANLPPFWLNELTGHFWSLCVEVQFYVGVAILFAVLGVRGLALLVPLCVAVTAWRIYTHAPVSIVTSQRVDEILAGAMLALALGAADDRPRRFLRALNPYVVLALFFVASHRYGGPANYARPYLAAALVGTTLLQPGRWIVGTLSIRPLKYIADISYALYVIHPLLGATWLGSGVGIEKYLKRPLLIAALFALAHLSTFQFEHRWIAFGKRLSARLRKPQPA